jgi:transposase
MAPYSMDLRTRVLRDWDAGMKADAVAVKYSVSCALVHRLQQRRPESGAPVGSTSMWTVLTVSGAGTMK